MLLAADRYALGRPPLQRRTEPERGLLRRLLGPQQRRRRLSGLRDSAMHDDPIRPALHIFRDALRPRVERALEASAQPATERLIERGIVDHGGSLNDLNLADPAELMKVLLNSEPMRRDLFRATNSVERLSQLLRMRNRWAHFDALSRRSVQADLGTRRLSAQGGRRPRASVGGGAAVPRRSAGRAGCRPLSRESELARKEQAHEAAAQALQADQEEVNARREALERQTADLAQRRSLLKRAEEAMEAERAGLRNREAALQRAPSPDALEQQRMELEAEHAAVAHLRGELESALDTSRTDAERRQRLERHLEQLAEQQRQTSAALNDRLAAVDERHAANADRSRALDDRQRALDLRESAQAAAQKIGQQPRSTPPPPSRQPSVRRRSLARVAQIPSAPTEPSLRSCRRPGCGGHLVQRQGRHGPFLGCSEFARKNCRYSEEIPDDLSAPPVDHGRCPECESPLQKRMSHSGPFLGCSSYPKCRYAEDIVAEAGAGAASGGE